MPAVGFGTAGLGSGTKAAVGSAHEAGYRHFDTAQAREWYREDLVGQALREPLSQDRESLFITSKLHPRHLGECHHMVHYVSALSCSWYCHELSRGRPFIVNFGALRTGYNTTMAQIRQSLEDLDSAYIDLFMLHYPECWDSLCGSRPPEGTWQDSWRALEVRRLPPFSLHTHPALRCATHG
jgi:diketogulonate reductase-like aldo/keto reductase